MGRPIFFEGTAILLTSRSGAADDDYVEMANGSAVAVSPANRVRARYNAGVQRFEVSENGNAYSSFLLLAGRAGGQIAIGGAAAGETLVFQDNAVDANQIAFTQGLLNGLLDGQTGQHDLQFRHLGLGTFPAGAGHLILGQELFTGTGNKVGIGMFPAYIATGTGNLYGVQGNVFFGGNLWGASSNVNALQFYPAPDYQYGSVAWGNANLNLLGITTGGMINIFSRTVVCNDLIGITVQTLAHIFGAPGAVSANRAIAVWIPTPSQTTGVISVQSGIQIDPQLYGVVNQGLWMNGNAVGSDIVFGTARSARIFYNGTNLVVNPALAGAGRVYIGPTGNRNMLLNDIEIDGALDHDGATLGLFATAPVARQTIAGSRGGNVALANLLTALALYGLVVDNTVP